MKLFGNSGKHGKHVAGASTPPEPEYRQPQEHEPEYRQPQEHEPEYRQPQEHEPEYRQPQEQDYGVQEPEYQDRPNEKAYYSPEEATENRRSPEEAAEINAQIAAYQKRKVKKRLIILAVLVVLVAAAVIFVKAYVRPPEIAHNEPLTTHTPAATPSSTVSAAPSATPSGEPTPSSTPSAEPTDSGDSLRKKDFYTFLIVGSDNGNGNTDTIMVGALDVANGKLNIVNIPRDTMVNVSWGTKKVNSIMSMSGDGIEGLKAGLKDILGFTVDSYMVVDLDAFVRLVDAIGGVYYNIPINMNYDDPQQNLHIHFSAGYQYLNGADAVKVVRFRQNNDGSGYGSMDIGRINTQQDFLKTVFKQCMKAENITNVSTLTEYAEIFADCVDTDLSTGNLLWYAQQIFSMDAEDISFMTMPEYYNDFYWGVSYCTITVDEWLEMVNKYLSPYNEQITTAHVNILTKDANRNLYSTTGTVAGGSGSFTDMRSSGSSSTPSATPTPTPSATPSDAGTEPPATPTDAGTEPSAEPTDAGTPPSTAPVEGEGESGTEPGGETGGESGGESTTPTDEPYVPDSAGTSSGRDLMAA